MTSRSLIIGALAVAVVIVAGYFVLTADDATPPQPTPPAKTQPKT